MKAVGIIAEYNPFHKGHAYQIQTAKELANADFAVVVMNGDFVQRGEPAFFDKYTRTRLALLGGADLVFELPSYYGVSSAEDFAFGSISVLHSLPFIEAVSFGIDQTISLDSLKKIASLLNNETDSYKNELFNALSSGKTFPAAREIALQKTLSLPAKAIPQNPNSILALEYIKALFSLNSSMDILPVERIGEDYHGSSSDSSFPSASTLRSNFFEKSKADFYKGLPYETHTIIEETLKNYRPLTIDDFSSELYYALLLNENHLTDFKDITSDLADRIREGLKSYSSASTLIEDLYAKNYTKGRISRSLLHVLLQIKKEKPTPYTRLLGMKKEASSLLKNQPHIIQKPARNKDTLAQEIFITNLYNQKVKALYGYDIGSEYVHSPIIL